MSKAINRVTEPPESIVNEVLADKIELTRRLATTYLYPIRAIVERGDSRNKCFVIIGDRQATMDRIISYECGADDLEPDIAYMASGRVCTEDQVIPMDDVDLVGALYEIV